MDASCAATDLGQLRPPLAANPGTNTKPLQGVAAAREGRIVRYVPASNCQDEIVPSPCVSAHRPSGTEAVCLLLGHPGTPGSGAAGLEATPEPQAVGARQSLRSVTGTDCPRTSSPPPVHEPVPAQQPPSTPDLDRPTRGPAMWGYLPRRASRQTSSLIRSPVNSRRSRLSSSSISGGAKRFPRRSAAASRFAP